MTLKVAATNVTDGPKIFNAEPHITVAPGDTAAWLNIGALELESMRATGNFDIVVHPASETPE